MSRYILVFILFSQACAVYVDHQDQLKITEVGDSVHLSCFSSRDTKTTIVWIKQNRGEKPVVIATSYQHQPGIFRNGFEESGRFKTQTAAESFNLTISNLEASDTATYYCAVIFFYDITFGEGTFLVVKGAPLTKHKVLQQSVLEAVHPGDPVTLQCTVLTESCSGEHSVYWFRHGSGESHAGIIYTHGNRGDECKKSSETDSPTQSCVYKLPKTNLSLSDAGTYYCAVAACGQILFGNGTELNITDNNPSLTVSTYFLILIYSNIISLLVIIFVVVMWCNNQSHSAGSPTCETCVDTHDACDEDLNFAALRLSNKPMSSRHNRRQHKFKDPDVYSKVIYQ